MTEHENVQQITAIIQDVGIWAVFAWLFINERRMHMEAVRDHIEDLRVSSARREFLAEKSLSQTPNEGTNPN